MFTAFRLQCSIQVGIRCRRRLDNVLATLDGAATANLLSLEYASQVGLTIERRPKSPLRLRLRDGSAICAVGVVKARFEILGAITHLGQFGALFLVVENLPFSCVFGNLAIKAFELLHDYYPTIDWTYFPISALFSVC
jgi:hypothetical protein